MIRPQDRLPLESPVCVHDWLWVPLIQAYRAAPVSNNGVVRK